MPDNRSIQLLETGAGWATLSLKTVECNTVTINPSYLTDVPFDIIKFFINCLENDKINYSVQFDEEPTIRWLRLYKDKIFVDEKQIQGSILEMAKQIVEDIEFNIKSWAFFYYDYCQNSPEQYEAKTPEYVSRLSSELNKLKDLISQQHD